MIRLVIARRPNQLQNRLLQMLKSLLLGTMAAVLMFIMATFLIHNVALTDGIAVTDGVKEVWLS